MTIPACGDGYFGDDALRWTVSAGSVGISQYGEQWSSLPSTFDTWRATALTTNSQGQAAGWQVDPIVVCLKRAVFWESNGTPRALWNLGLLNPIGTSEARSMTSTDVGLGVTVVGKDLGGDEGIIWWRPSTPSSPGSGQFVAYRGRDLHLNNCGWYFREFNAINNRGWIVGWADAPPGSPFPPKRGVLLIPDVCPSDINGDGISDGADMGIVLGGWGPCITLCCDADLNIDGQVNGTDLAIVLGAWGNACSIVAVCDELPCAPPFASSAVFGVPTDESLDGSSFAIETLLAAFGQPSVEALGEWINTLDASQQQNVLATTATVLGSGGDW